MNKKIKYGTTEIDIPKDYVLNNKLYNPLTKTNNIASKNGVKSIKIKTKDIDKPTIKNDGEYIDIKKKRVYKKKSENITPIKKHAKKENVNLNDDIKKIDMPHICAYSTQVNEPIKVNESSTSNNI